MESKKKFIVLRSNLLANQIKKWTINFNKAYEYGIT